MSLCGSMIANPTSHMKTNRASHLRNCLKLFVLAGVLVAASAVTPALAQTPPLSATAPSITTQPVSLTVVTGANANLSVVATGTAPLRYQWFKNGIEIARAESALLALGNVRLNEAAVYAVRVSNDAGSVTSAPASLTVNATAGTITAAVPSTTVKAGAEAKLTVVTSGNGLSYEWRFNDRLIRGATGATLTIANPGTTAAGYYEVSVAVRNAPIAISAAKLTVTTDARLVNIASRGMVGAEDDEVLISGFVTRGTGTKTVLLRGVGPTLGGSPYNVQGALANPTITLFSGSTTVATNDNWGGTAPLTAAFTKVGAFPLASPTSTDAAMLQTIPSGGYTAHVTGLANARGIALIEVYDTDAASPPVELANISTRAMVGAVEDGTLIAGFVIAGSTSNTILVRGVSQSLGTLYGLRRALGNSQIAVFDSANKEVAANAVWTKPGRGNPNDADNDDQIFDIDEAGNRTGAFKLPRGSNDSALLLTLRPGAYTAHVTGRNNSSGVALVEIYEVR
jgi:hypothetical protein